LRGVLGSIRQLVARVRVSVHRITLRSGSVRHQVRWRENGSNRSRNFDKRAEANAFDRQIRLQLDLRVLPHFGERRAREVTVGDVERWITHLRSDGDHDPTILKACTVLQALLTMAVRDGVLQYNVAQQARKPAQGRTRIPYLIKPEAVERMRAWFMAHGSERDVVLLELLAYAGLRPESEAITLPWRYVRDRSLVVRDTKRGRERTVVLLEPLAQTLTGWRLRRGRPGPDLLVVPAKHDGAWSAEDWRSWRRYRFKPAALAAGLPADVRPRDLRGSLVTLLVHEGRSITEVARQVGHSPTICLRDYSQVFDDADPTKRIPAPDMIRHARDLAARPPADQDKERHAG
jgi:site-specific recombinase XerD